MINNSDMLPLKLKAWIINFIRIQPRYAVKSSKPMLTIMHVDAIFTYESPFICWHSLCGYTSYHLRVLEQCKDIFVSSVVTCNPGALICVLKAITGGANQNVFDGCTAVFIFLRRGSDLRIVKVSDDVEFIVKGFKMLW